VRLLPRDKLGPPIRGRIEGMALDTDAPILTPGRGWRRFGVDREEVAAGQSGAAKRSAHAWSTSRHFLYFAARPPKADYRLLFNTHYYVLRTDYWIRVILDLNIAKRQMTGTRNHWVTMFSRWAARSDARGRTIDATIATS
jgi:hypothetical protein